MLALVFPCLGVKKISFFTDFWFINKTGLRLLYRQPAGLGSADAAPGQVKAAADDSIWDLVGEPRDWFFKDYIKAAEQPLPFAFTTGLERKKQLKIKVLDMIPPRKTP